MIRDHTLRVTCARELQNQQFILHFFGRARKIMCTLILLFLWSCPDGIAQPENRGHLDVVIAIDGSFSMQNYSSLVVTTCDQIIGTLRPDDRVALLSFYQAGGQAHSLETLQELKNVSDRGNGFCSSFQAFLRSTKYYSSIVHGLNRSLNYMLNASFNDPSNSRPVLLLLTDGTLDEVPNSNTELNSLLANFESQRTDSIFPLHVYQINFSQNVNTAGQAIHSALGNSLNGAFVDASLDDTLNNLISNTLPNLRPTFPSPPDLSPPPPETEPRSYLIYLLITGAFLFLIFSLSLLASRKPPFGTVLYFGPRGRRYTMPLSTLKRRGFFSKKYDFYVDNKYIGYFTTKKSNNNIFVVLYPGVNNQVYFNGRSLQSLYLHNLDTFELDEKEFQYSSKLVPTRALYAL